eukprot:1392921-Amorphochlora_amoeboformis.AAC.1
MTGRCGWRGRRGTDPVRRAYIAARVSPDAMSEYDAVCGWDYETLRDPRKYQSRDYSANAKWLRASTKVSSKRGDVE